MRVIQYIKWDRDDGFTKACKSGIYIVNWLGFVIVLLCGLVSSIICTDLSGPKVLLYAVCVCGYLADVLLMRNDLKPRLSEEAKEYLQASFRLKKAIRILTNKL